MIIIVIHKHVEDVNMAVRNVFLNKNNNDIMILN